MLKDFSGAETMMLWSIVLQDNDGLIERWKRKDLENIIELHNKAPVWNEGLYSIHIVTDVEVTIGNYFPEVGNNCPTPKAEVCLLFGYARNN